MRQLGRLALALALLLLLLAADAKKCFDDARLCRSGELLFREPARDCEFPLCAEVDAQVTDADGCDTDAFTCANGDIVYRDPSRLCEFAACPSAAPPTLSPSSSFPAAPTTGNAIGGGSGCPRDALVCPGGNFFVRRNAALGCAFDACPALQGDSCPGDTRRCAGDTVVRRNPQNRCLFDACPP